MTSRQWTLVKSVFASALEIDPRQRDEWLRGRAELSPKVVAEVLRLLAASESATSLAPFSPPEIKPQPSADLVGQTLLNRFEVVSLLGSGAMGDVYCAFDRSINEAVAFKTIRPHLANQPEVIASLTREVALARRVSHENVCQIRDLHREPNPPIGPLLFFTMELLSGQTLAAQLAQGPLPLPEILKIAHGIAAGINAIHARSLIHRDLKPSNVFWVRSDGHPPRAVITDFGLCFDEKRPVAETLTAFGPEAVIGTPSYMAPEQLLGKGATQQSDIYSFGVLLFEMVTGRLPFAGDSPLAIALRRLQEEPPEARTLVKDLPKRWNSTIAACLQRDPARRPESALDVVAALEGRKKLGANLPSRRALLISASTAAVAAAGGLAWWKLEPPATPIPDPQAEHHLKIGQEYIREDSRESIQNGIAELKQAIAINPRYADAWANLADAYCMDANYLNMPSRQALALASDAANRALALDPRQPKAHAATAYVQSCDLHHWRAAEPTFKQAISLDPKNPTARSWYANFLGRASRFDEAVAMATSALDLDPGSARLSNRLATELFRARRFDQLRAQMIEFIRLHRAEVYGYALLARAYEWLKQYDAATQSLKSADSLPEHATTTNFWATLHAAEGNLKQARAESDVLRTGWLAQKEESNVYLYTLGALYMAQPDPSLVQEMAGVMNEAIRRDDETVLAAATNPYLQDVRRHPLLVPIFKQLDFA